MGYPSYPCTSILPGNLVRIPGGILPWDILHIHALAYFQEILYSWNFNLGYPCTSILPGNLVFLEFPTWHQPTNYHSTITEANCKYIHGSSQSATR